MAPKLLWPEPPRTSRGLNAHARPRLISSRLQLLRAGDWHALVHDMPPPPAVDGLVSAVPQRPGLVTPQRAKAVVVATQHGLLTKAWRQIWGY
eukprot:3667088-Amphidinium_carterae.1